MIRYILLISWLQYVNTSIKVHDVVLVYSFFLKLCALLGFYPVLDECVIKKEKIGYEEACFSASLGGVICRECSVSIHKQSVNMAPFSFEERNRFQTLLSAEWDSLPQLMSAKERVIIEQFGEYHIGQKVASWNSFKAKTAL